MQNASPPRNAHRTYQIHALRVFILGLALFGTSAQAQLESIPALTSTPALLGYWSAGGRIAPTAMEACAIRIYFWYPGFSLTGAANNFCQQTNSAPPYNVIEAPVVYPIYYCPPASGKPPMTSDMAPGNMATSTCPPPYPPCPVDAANPWTYVAASNTCQRTVASPPAVNLPPVCPANMSGTPCACNAGYVPYPNGGCILTPTCPANMAGNPCACNAGYQLDAAGTSCVLEQYTIALDQKDAILEPSNTAALNVKTSQTFTATVTNGVTRQPKAGTRVAIKADVKQGTGGHVHTDNLHRPKGYLGRDVSAALCDPNAAQPQACITGVTDAKGQFTFVFSSPEVSGEHTVIATCDMCTGSEGKADVKVMVAGLEKIPASVFFTKITPNADTNHPNTSFLTTEAIARLQEIGLQYAVMGLVDFAQFLPPLQINDGSLIWGGVLDCFLTCNSNSFPSTPWSKHHIEHRRGTVVDIRANGGVGSIPTNKKMTESYIAMVRNLVLKKYPGIKSKVPIAGIHGKGDGRHFHVQLLGVKE